MKQQSNSQSKSNWLLRQLGFLYLFFGIPILVFSQSPTGNIDQASNGKLASPNDPVKWVNGDLNETTNHYLEAQSIPYRVKIDRIPLGVPIKVVIGFDVRHNGHVSIDYLTSYDQPGPHALKYGAGHVEAIDPRTGILASTVTPVYANIPSPGTKNSPLGYLNQPEASFNLIQAAGKTKMTLYNASFDGPLKWVTGLEPDYSEVNATNEAQLEVTFIATALPVVFAWGGHIASRFDWGYVPNGQPRSAGGITGASYHTRLKTMFVNGVENSLGNQDMSLKVAAPICNLDLVVNAQTNINCFGDSNQGSVSLLASGGITPYTYSIDTGRTYQSSDQFSSLKAGTYLFWVRDQIGCIDSVKATITQPDSALLSMGKVTDVNCFGDSTGAIDLSVYGGTRDYSFDWSNGAKTEDLSNLKAGQYIVTITDKNGCVLKDTFAIAQPDSALLSMGKVTDVNCFEDSTGAIDLSVYGGTRDYSFDWSNGAKTEDLSNLKAGQYIVTITDKNGCVLKDTFAIAQPDSALLSMGKVTDVNCFGDSAGAIDLSVYGGTRDYSFDWSNGAKTEDLSNLKAGQYIVTITDENGCVLKDTFAIAQPDSALLSMGKVTDVNCFGDSTGAIDLSVYGGTRDYSFDWSNGAKTEDLSNLKAGQYIVTITDKNGCVLKDTFAIAQPDSSLLSMGKVTDVNCFGDSTGAIDLSVYGGTRDYSFNWSNGAKTEDLSNLKAGQYIVTITDKNGCVLKDTFAIAQPDSALLSMGKVTDVNCFGDSTGAIDLSVYGGTRDYSFDWSNGAKTEDLSNLKAGQYIVTITDKNGCVLKDTFAIAQPDSALLSMGKVTDVNCFGDSTGAIDLSVYGGTRDYSFDWSNGAKTEDLSNLKAGQYIVTITDENGCVLKDTFAIAQPDSALLSMGKVTDVNCFGDSTGAIDLSVYGGTRDYSFDWSNGAKTEDLSNLKAGQYIVTITDKNGCVLKDTFAIAQSDPLVVIAYDTTVCAKERILLRASLEGGVWSGTGIDGNYFEWPTPGTYKVVYTYTNVKGCVARDTATVTVKLCESGFCTYTQGYYGNKGGLACFQGQKITTKGLVQKALLSGPIVLGKASLNKTFTVSYAAADSVIMILPGGGPSSALAYTGNRTPSTLPSSMLKNGRIYNGLLAQTLTLALNMRVNEGLGDFELLSEKYLMTQDKAGCGSDSVKKCAYHSYRLNNKVVQALGAENTVSGLMDMANKALAGVLPTGLSFSDINSAVDLINNAFDGCRVGWYADTIVYCPDLTLISSALNNGFVQQENKRITPQVVVYPNPFKDRITFKIIMPENGKGSLSIYTASGQLLSTVFEQQISAGTMFTYDYKAPVNWKGNLFYVFRFNGKLYSGKLMRE